MTGTSATARMAPRQLDAVGAGQHQVQQRQLGLLLLHQAQRLLRVPGDHRPVARIDQGVPDVAQVVGVVVHHQHPHRLAGLYRFPPRGAG